MCFRRTTLSTLHNLSAPAQLWKLMDLKMTITVSPTNWQYNIRLLPCTQTHFFFLSNNGWQKLLSSQKQQQLQKVTHCFHRLACSVMFINQSYEKLAVLQSIPYLTTICTSTFLSSSPDWPLLETKFWSKLIMSLKHYNNSYSQLSATLHRKWTEALKHSCIAASIKYFKAINEKYLLSV